ncbi:MAG: carbohydrate kinase family protein [Actinobacteria bacterium]|nr:carbohydrate kinase family protein [Actinomycetota bacterium]
MTSVICIGDAMMDVIVRMEGSIKANSDTLSEISMHGGGAAANTASWLASLGVDTTFIGRIGSDILGSNFHNELLAQGVKHPNPPIANMKTGVVVVLVDQDGNRTMFPDAGANSGLDEKDLPDLTGLDGAFLSGYSLFNPISTEGVQRIIKTLRAASIPIYFDLASVGTISAFGFERAKELLSGFEGLFLNEEEALFITRESKVEEQVSYLLKLSKLVVIKLGSNGAVGKSRDSELISKAASDSEVLDTTGAGDSFAAGFLSSWLVKQDLSEALAKGIEVAGKCVATIGARPRVNP